MVQKIGKKGFFSIVCTALFILLATVFITQSGFFVNAAGETNENSFVGSFNPDGTDLQLHTDTAAESNDIVQPVFTVFAGGENGNAAEWSNKDGELYYDSNSFMSINAGRNWSKVYLAQMERGADECFTHECTTLCKRTFTLYELTKGDISADGYNYVKTPVGELVEFDRHSIIIFEETQTTPDFIPGANNMGTSLAYAELHKLLDTLDYNYKSFSGFHAQFNLVGFARGAILNMMYAIDHPYNVKTMTSIGANFAGMPIMQNADLQSMYQYIPEYPSIVDLETTALQQTLKTRWNALYATGAINFPFTAFGGITKLSFLDEMISGNKFNGFDADKTLLTGVRDLLKNYETKALTEISADPDYLSKVIWTSDISVNPDSCFKPFPPTPTAQKNLFKAIIAQSAMRYGELVVMDDFYYSYASQTAEGFAGVTVQDIVFNGSEDFSRIGKFDAICLPHNLSSRSGEVVNRLDSIIDVYYGKIYSDYKTVYFEDIGNYNLHLPDGGVGRLFFEPYITGDYIISSPAKQYLYITILEKDYADAIIYKTLKINGTDSFKVTLDKDKEYRFYVRLQAVHQTGTLNVNITLPLWTDNLNQYITIANGAAQAYIYLPDETCIKTLKKDHPNIKMTLYKQKTALDFSYYGQELSSIFEGGKRYIVVLENMATSMDITVKLGMSDALSVLPESTHGFDIEGAGYRQFIAPQSQSYTFRFENIKDTMELKFYDKNFNQVLYTPEV